MRIIRVVIEVATMLNKLVYKG